MGLGGWMEDRVGWWGGGWGGGVVVYARSVVDWFCLVVFGLRWWRTGCSAVYPTPVNVLFPPFFWFSYS